MTSAKARIANQKTRLKNNGISVRISVIQEGLFCFSDSISYISALILYSFCMALSVIRSVSIWKRGRFREDLVRISELR